MVKIFSTVTLSLTIYIALFLPILALAHGEAGLTFTDAVDGYQLDVDYEAESIQAKNIGARFTFNIFSDEAKTQPVEYSDLWVRIVQNNGTENGKTIFAGPVYNARFGGAGFLYMFPEGGKYTMYVRYNRENKEAVLDSSIVEGVFDMNVLRSTDEKRFSFGLEFWLGLMIGVFGVIILTMPLLMNRRKVKEVSKIID